MTLFGYGVSSTLQVFLSVLMKRLPPVDPDGIPCDCWLQSAIVRQSAAAAKTLCSFVRMPLMKHGSGKAIEHWRGSRSAPLDQIPLMANLGGRVQKGEGKRCQMVVVRIAAPGGQNRSRACR